MSEQFQIDADGTLAVTMEQTQTDEHGAQSVGVTTWQISPAQIDAHRLDQKFDAALPADIRAELDGA